MLAAMSLFGPRDHSCVVSCELTIGNLWQNDATACAASGFFAAQAAASPLLMGFHATAEVASKATTKSAKSLMGKRIFGIFAAGRVAASWERKGRIVRGGLHVFGYCSAYDACS